MSYQFLDANSSILTAQSSVIGGIHYPIVFTSMLGVLPIIQSGITITSVVGGYAEDAPSTSGDIGLFTLRVRNDTVTSIASNDLDYIASAVDSAGRTITIPFAPQESRVFSQSSTVSAVSVLAVAAAGAGLRNYITDVMIANTGSVASLVTFTDGDGSVLGRTIAPATGGSNINGMASPMKTSPNQPFNIVSGTQTSVLYATVIGYKAP